MPVDIHNGQAAPSFSTRGFSIEAGEFDFDLGSKKGKIVILAFYPKDDTPGCTKEMCAFRDDLAQFQAAGVEVYGVSRDSLAKHQKFAAKYSFAALPLLSDEDGSVSEAFGVGDPLPKRSLFIIDTEGKVAYQQQGMPNNKTLLELVQKL